MIKKVQHAIITGIGRALEAQHKCTHIMKEVIKTFLTDKAARNTVALTALMGAVMVAGDPWHVA